MIKLNETICHLIDNVLPSEIKKQMASSLAAMTTNSNNHLIRIIHYPPIDINIKAERATAHTDICLFTMVFGALFNGLEFQSHDGEWFEPKMNSLEIVMFNSEMLEICTNGHLRAVVHRVKSDPESNTESRFSVPIGFHPLKTATLKHGLTAAQYLRNKLNEISYNGDLLDTKEH